MKLLKFPLKKNLQSKAVSKLLGGGGGGPLFIQILWCSEKENCWHSITGFCSVSWEDLLRISALSPDEIEFGGSRLCV